jgi:hypothetical protein
MSPVPTDLRWFQEAEGLNFSAEGIEISGFAAFKYEGTIPFFWWRA